MTMRERILQCLATTVEKYSPVPFPDDVSDQTELQDFWLDSVVFMELLNRIEDDVGYMPQEILDGSRYPQTIGELVEMYDSVAASE